MQTENFCSYIQHENDIHEVVFKIASRNAVDECLVHLQNIALCRLENRTALVLINLEQIGLLPLTYTFQQARGLIRRAPPTFPVRIALVHNSEFPLSVFNTFLRRMPLNINYEIRHFICGRSAAVAWLLSG